MAPTSDNEQPNQDQQFAPWRQFNVSMERALMNFVEEKKGADSILREDYAAGLKEVQQYLKKNVPMDQLNVNLTTSTIQNKLRDTVKTKRISAKTTPRMFFEDGIKLLDLKKFRKGVFSQEEVQTAQKKRERPKNSGSGGPPTKKTKLL